MHAHLRYHDGLETRQEHEDQIIKAYEASSRFRHKMNARPRLDVDSQVPDQAAIE